MVEIGSLNGKLLVQFGEDEPIEVGSIDMPIRTTSDPSTYAPQYSFSPGEAYIAENFDTDELLARIKRTQKAFYGI